MIKNIILTLIAITLTFTNLPEIKVNALKKCPDETYAVNNCVGKQNIPKEGSTTTSPSATNPVNTNIPLLGVTIPNSKASNLKKTTNKPISALNKALAGSTTANKNSAFGSKFESLLSNNYSTALNNKVNITNCDPMKTTNVTLAKTKPCTNLMKECAKTPKAVQCQTPFLQSKNVTNSKLATIVDCRTLIGQNKNKIICQNQCKLDVLDVKILEKCPIKNYKSTRPRPSNSNISENAIAGLDKSSVNNSKINIPKVSSFTGASSDPAFASIMDKISTTYNRQCGAYFDSKPIIGKSGYGWQTTNSLRGNGTGCCYGAVWAGLLMNKAANPSSPFAKAFTTIDVATAKYGSAANDFHTAMQAKDYKTGKRYYELAGLKYTTDPQTAPIGSIIVEPTITPGYGDINVKTGNKKFVNYSTMGFMNSTTVAYVYSPATN
jgi:hypothetical protein